VSRDRSQGRDCDDTRLAHSSVQADSAASRPSLNGRANNGNVDAHERADGRDDRLIDANRNDPADGARHVAHRNDAVDNVVNNEDVVGEFGQLVADDELELRGLLEAVPTLREAILRIQPIADDLQTGKHTTTTISGNC
jgi:hypothetical protein